MGTPGHRSASGYADRCSRLRACAKATRTDYLLLALPCHAQLNAEELKNDGAAACLLKPLTATRLLPCCSIGTLPSQPRLPFAARVNDEQKLPMSVMAVDDNPANLKLIGALLEDQVQHVGAVHQRRAGG